MELYERIRNLRKNYLHLSQTEFGDRLGVSRSVIKNIELNALAKPEQKLSLLKLICKEFSVNEEWLINGTGSMFKEPDTFNLHDFAKEHNITKLETEIVKTYLELDPDLRNTLVEHFKTHLLNHAIGNSEKEPTTEDLEAEYKKRISATARSMESTALNTTESIENEKEA